MLRSIKRIARRYIEKRGFVRGSAAPNVHTVLARLPKVNVATVIDVGASDGRWSAEIMRYFSDARYLLVEAQEQAHGAALQRFRADHSNVVYEICAAGDSEGEIHFDATYPFGGQASSTPFRKNDITVPMNTVDNLVRKYGFRGPFLLKLDTHGFEVPILEGARETLSKASMLIIEAYNYAMCPGCLRFHELCFVLEARGFRCADIYDLGTRPRDNAFYYMDMVFLPSSNPIFESNRFFGDEHPEYREV